MEQFRIISLSHKNLPVEDLGAFHISDEHLATRLSALIHLPGVEEAMLLSTCNRVEFLLSSQVLIDRPFLERFFQAVYPDMALSGLQLAVDRALIYSGEDAVLHLFRVASSLDSLIVGEREIITQVRNAYERCHECGVTGDLLRLVIKKTIETGKEVYSSTNISRHPVSVVSLAYRKLRDLNVKLNARFILIGAGVTITTFAKFLRKHGYTNFVVFNRSLDRAVTLAAELNAVCHPLTELPEYTDGFDVIVTCTGSSEPLITPEVYGNLLAGDTKRKIVVDLAVPGDLHKEIHALYDVHVISVSSLRDVAEKNLREREKEMGSCEVILEENLQEFRIGFRARQVELAMQEVPRKVREIREVALNEVFARDLSAMDDASKKVLSKVIDYLEKKYISVPMKMAKEILLEESSQK
ncbi:MAG: glutamyl-tRNA reductase [Bacteroidia bacterium]|nr:glutamyl-tRNA reductase [Bacteroidia bacterium]